MAGTPSYERRNAKAQALGYRNYYDYRTRGRNGTVPASKAKKPTGDALAKARGHRGPKDIIRETKPGDVVRVNKTGPRNSRGQFEWVEYSVLGKDGKERIYRVKGKKNTSVLKTLSKNGAKSPVGGSPDLIADYGLEEETPDDDEALVKTAAIGSNPDADIPF